MQTHCEIIICKIFKVLIEFICSPAKTALSATKKKKKRIFFFFSVSQKVDGRSEKHWHSCLKQEVGRTVRS